MQSNKKNNSGRKLKVLKNNIKVSEGDQKSKTTISDENKSIINFKLNKVSKDFLNQDFQIPNIGGFLINGFFGNKFTMEQLVEEFNKLTIIEEKSENFINDDLEDSLETSLQKNQVNNDINSSSNQPIGGNDKSKLKRELENVQDKSGNRKILKSNGKTIRTVIIPTIHSITPSPSKSSNSVLLVENDPFTSIYSYCQNGDQILDVENILLFFKKFGTSDILNEKNKPLVSLRTGEVTEIFSFGIVFKNYKEASNACANGKIITLNRKKLKLNIKFHPNYQNAPIRK